MGDQSTRPASTGGGCAGEQHASGQLASHRSAVRRASAGLLVPANASFSALTSCSADAQVHSAGQISAARDGSAAYRAAGHGAGMSPWGGSSPASTALSTCRAPPSVCGSSVPSPALLPSPLYSTPRCLGAVNSYYRASAAGKPQTRGQQGRNAHSNLVRTAAARVIASAPSPHGMQHAPPHAVVPAGAPSMSQPPHRGRGQPVGASQRLKALHEAQQCVLSSLGIDGEADHANAMDAGAVEPHAWWNIDCAAPGSGVSGAIGGAAEEEHDTSAARANWRDAVLEAQRRRDEVLDALLASHKKRSAWR